MANGWTTERRARQAAQISRWRPWDKSTGRRTAGGKAKASRNAYRGGPRAQLRGLARVLRQIERVARSRTTTYPDGPVQKAGQTWQGNCFSRDGCFAARPGLCFACRAGAERAPVGQRKGRTSCG
jgi:hypothetical protein